MSKRANRFNEHHPIPTSRERNSWAENIEDAKDILFRNLTKQPTVRMRVREHDALHASNSMKIQD